MIQSHVLEVGFVVVLNEPSAIWFWEAGTNKIHMADPRTGRVFMIDVLESIPEDVDVAIEMAEYHAEFVVAMKF